MGRGAKPMGEGLPGSASQHIQRLFAEGSLGGLSDGQLLERYLARGDELAFEALVGRHAAMVLAVCRRSLDEPGDVDDAFQATFLVLARRSRAVRDRDALGGWLFGVARRVCLLANRAASRRRKHERGAAESREPREIGVRGRRRAWGLDLRGDRAAPVGLSPAGRPLPDGGKEPGGGRRPASMDRGHGPRPSGTRPAPAPDAPDPPRRGAGHGSGGPHARRCGRGRLAERDDRAGSAGRGPRGDGHGLGRGGGADRGVIQIMLLKKLDAVRHHPAGSGPRGLGRHRGPDRRRGPGSARHHAAGRGTAAPPASSSGTVPLDDPGKAALHGRVLAPDGTPVAGARVWAGIPRGQDLAEARTDAEGRFRLGPIEPLLPVPLRSDRRRRRLRPPVDPAMGPLSSSPAWTVISATSRSIGAGSSRGRSSTWTASRGRTRRSSRRSFGTSRGTRSRRSAPGQTLTTDAEGRFRTPPLPVGHSG